MPKVSRSVIYAQDIMRITGRSRRYGYRLIARIKEYLNKSEHQMITLDEYADFHGIPVSKVMEYIEKSEESTNKKVQ
ncbi:hypothetical protein [Aquiflexum sp.]|uniref:hypothetical protein n=1 Tax=Aquiflexum sp. TaxID=1872584 RepID=UPI003593FFA4